MILQSWRLPLREVSNNRAVRRIPFSVFTCFDICRKPKYHIKYCDTLFNEGGNSLAKKAISVWLFTSLTFISLLHLIEAISAVAFNNPIRLLQLYPFLNEKLQNITPTAYFWISATATFILWGITCAIAFDNPVEKFLNIVLSDAKKQSAVETQLLEEKGEILDVMNETIESNNETLNHLRDVIYNVRTEIKEFHPMKEGIEKMKAEISTLKKEIKKLEEKS